MASIRSMVNGSPGRLIISFALPLMLGNLFQQFYTIADAAIVGQVLGVNAIAAVGAAEWIIWMVQGIIQGFAQGFAIQMSLDFGAGKYQKLRNAILHSAFLSVGIALFLFVGGQALAGWLLNLLHTPANVFGDTMCYMRTMFWGISAIMAYNLSASILRALGDGKTPLYAMVSASIINIALDLLFVPVLQMGVLGAAAATIIAQCCSGVFCLIKILHIDILKFQQVDFVYSLSLYLRLMTLGIPMAFQNAVISVGGMIVQYVINGFGVAFIAGFTATNKLYGMLEVAGTSYGYAMTTYTGQNLGAGEIERIRKGYRIALVIAIGTSVFIGMIMIVFGKWLLMCFISGDRETAANALEIAFHYLFIMSICLPILYYLHVTRACIQGLGNTVLPMVSGCAEFVMRSGAALLLPVVLGQEGIFYAEIAAWAGADVILVFSFYYCMKKVKAIGSTRSGSRCER